LYTNFSLQKRGREGGEERQQQQQRQEEERRRREEQEEEEEQAKTPVPEADRKTKRGERETKRGKDQRRENFLALTTKSGTKEPSVLGNLRKMPAQRTVGSG
jgi:hypothetical protein